MDEGLASRLGAQPDMSAAVRRDAPRRWQRACAAVLTAGQAADAVGAPLSTLYRWQKWSEPRSRTSQRIRQRSWSSELIGAVERLRGEFPM